MALPDALPARVPVSLYQSIALRLRWGAALVRGLSRVSTPKASEDPRWVTFDNRAWRRHRDALLGRGFDAADNPAQLDRRLARLQLMYAADPDAAILAHRFGFAQLPGEQHKFAGCDTPAAFLDAMRTLDGQAHCFVAFVRSSQRLLQLGRRLDPTKRARRGHGTWRLGDYSEIAAIWAGARHGSLDKRLLLHVDFAMKDGGDHAAVG
jgi:hypothetical protein